MRASELLALTPSDIERKHEGITITNGKGGKERKLHVWNRERTGDPPEIIDAVTGTRYFPNVKK
jgi:integrase